MAPLNLSKKKKNSKHNNPYSSRGLEKFYSVLSELQAKEKKIMSGASSNDVALVRFMYSNSRDWTPVIVRHREHDGDDDNTRSEEVLAQSPEELGKMEKEMRWWRWRPSYYMLVVMLIILICFVVSGRAFAICCVSVWWYLLPVLKEETGNNGRKNVSKEKY